MCAIGGIGLRAAAADPVDALTIEAAGSFHKVVTGSRQLEVHGDTELTVGVAEAQGGDVRVVAGPGRLLPRAFRFPSFVSSGPYPRAVVTLHPVRGESLSPGAADFTFGAVFRSSRARQAGVPDDGDNLFQRGRHADGSMFKLQLDDGRASCVVEGRAGRVMVRSSGPLTGGVWHRVTCSRVGARLVMRVARYVSGEVTDRRTAKGSTGEIRFDPATLASIGGKLRASGRVVAADTDQFNGDVATVWTRRN